MSLKQVTMFILTENGECGSSNFGKNCSQTPFSTTNCCSLKKLENILRANQQKTCIFF